ncbi:MAG: YezD family protein [Candidatus Levybacteria bacterium]|nr:YezD family protein [Candidatus Levybacteria bacterium]
MNVSEVNADALKEILKALGGIKYGSVEIIVQDGHITQISTRIIKKTKVSLKENKKIAGLVLRKGSGSGINLNFKY